MEYFGMLGRNIGWLNEPAIPLSEPAPWLDHPWPVKIVTQNCLTTKIRQKIPLKSAHLAPQMLWQLVLSVHQGWRKTSNIVKRKGIKDARNLGTTADSSTASCSMRADSTSKGPGNSEYTEMQYSREELTYSVARRYDEVISAGKEPKIPILWRIILSATRNEVGSPRLALRDRRWDKSRQQSN